MSPLPSTRAPFCFSDPTLLFGEMLQGMPEKDFTRRVVYPMVVGIMHRFGGIGIVGYRSACS